jgi:hypothetical protein
VIGTLPSRKAQADRLASVATRLAAGKLNGTKVPCSTPPTPGSRWWSRRARRPRARAGRARAKGARSRVGSFDPSRSVAKLAFQGAPAELLGSEAGGVARIDTLLDRAAVMMGFEQIGGATRAFEITREFTLGRYAFGRPIASFQAVKHRSPSCTPKIEMARSTTRVGALAARLAAAALPRRCERRLQLAAKR